MHSACSLSSHIEAGDVCITFFVYLDSTILVMKGWILIFEAPEQQILKWEEYLSKSANKGKYIPLNSTHLQVSD